MGIRNICFVGAGHVGAPTATVLAFFNPNFHINVVDKSDTLIRKWNSRHIPLHNEPGLRYLVRVTRDGTLPTLAWTDDDHTVERSARNTNLLFSSDVERCLKVADMVFLCVETPTRKEGKAKRFATDTRPLEKAVQEVAKWGKDGVILVVKSTVPVGMAGRITGMINEVRPEMSFEVLSNPEFLSEGDAVNNLLKPERVVIGSTMTDNGHAAAMALANVYRSWVGPAKIQTMSSSSAELTKLAANAMLAQRISSINAISSICERSGADIADIQIALGSDSRIGSACLRAGIGFGGSCLKKDIIGLVHLAKTLNLPSVGEYWLQVLRMNHAQSRRFAERVVSRLEGSLADKKLAIFGWAFKKGTSDMRETRSVHVLKELLKKSVKDVAIFDPGCDPADVQNEAQSTKRFVAWKSERPHSNVAVHEDPYTACQGADAVLILTDWDQFRCLPKPKRPPLVPSREAGAEDTLGSPSYFSRTDGTPCEVGLSLSKLSIRDDKSLGKTSRSVGNTFSRLKPDLPCPSDCKDCWKTTTAWSISEGVVDWKRISAAMKSPKWVFDGRNVLNIVEMEKLGFKVEAVGKASIWKPFEGDVCSNLIDQPKQ